MKDLPVEAGLRDLARRFAEAERRVISLLREAPTGDRRALLINTLHIFAELRRDALSGQIEIEATYRYAAVAINLLTDLPETSSERAQPLGRTLASRLLYGVATAEQGARQAFATATSGTLDDAERLAVGGRKDRGGRLWPIGTDAAMLTATLGRRAVSSAGLDMLGASAGVIIGGGQCAICLPTQGEQPATVTPPFHPHCDCVATPEGFSAGAHLRAMRSAVAEPALA